MQPGCEFLGPDALPGGQAVHSTVYCTEQTLLYSKTAMYVLSIVHTYINIQILCMALNPIYKYSNNAFFLPV